MHKHQKSIFAAIILSESTHIFCCVLPTLFSIVSLLSGFGLMVTMPGWLAALHENMHVWELPLLALSASVVGAGWALYAYSRKIDCHDTGCHHGDCTPRKHTANWILIVASGLLIVNVAVYFGFHRGQVLEHAGQHHAQDL